MENIYVKNSFTNVGNYDSSRVRYTTDIKSAGFRSQFEASHVSIQTEQLLYSETRSLRMTVYIYIYIYIYIG